METIKLRSGVIIKKGFTLVELLMVISLMALLIVIAVPSGITISKKIKNNMLEKKIEIIESGAIVYGQNNKSKINNSTDTCTIDGTDYKCKKITVKELIDNNYLESDSNDNISLKNPANDKEMKYNYVYVYMMNKRVYSKFSDDLYYNIIAKDSVISGGVHTDKFDIELEGLGPVEYKWNNEDYVEYKPGDLNNISSERNNQTLYIKWTEGGEEVVQEYIVRYNTSETSVNFNVSYIPSTALATLSLNASDSDGIKDYKITDTLSSCDSNDGWTLVDNTNLSKTQPFGDVSLQGKKYYACVRDNSGDITTKDLYVHNCKIEPGAYFKCDVADKWGFLVYYYELDYDFYNIKINNGNNLYINFKTPKDSTYEKLLIGGSTNNYGNDTHEGDMYNHGLGISCAGIIDVNVRIRSGDASSTCYTTTLGRH